MDRSESPFAKAANRVTKLLERQRQLELAGGDGLLAFFSHRPVVTDVGVAGMLAGHQDAARGAQTLWPA